MALEHWVDQLDKELDIIRGKSYFVTKGPSSPVAYVANTWVDLFSFKTSYMTRIKAIKLTNDASPSGHAFRICSPAGEVVFDGWEGTNNTFTSGTRLVLDEYLQIPKGQEVVIQVYCTTASGNVTLDELNVIEYRRVEVTE
jgi:hypothetical protein